MAEQTGSGIPLLPAPGNGRGQTQAQGSEVLLGGEEIVVAGVSYRMRGFDTTLARTVYWTSDIVDASGTDYTGPGPLTTIVVQMIIPGA